MKTLGYLYTSNFRWQLLSDEQVPSKEPEWDDYSTEEKEQIEWQQKKQELSQNIMPLSTNTEWPRLWLVGVIVMTGQLL